MKRTVLIGAAFAILGYVLGAMPSAQSNVSVQTVGFSKVFNYGETPVLVQNGPISLVGECRPDVSGMNDQVRILAATTVPGAFLDADSNHTGPGNGSDFLNPDTPADSRQYADGLTSVPGGAAVEFDIDSAFVVGPNGEFIGLSEADSVFGLNVLGGNCWVAGVAQLLPAVSSGGGP